MALAETILTILGLLATGVGIYGGWRGIQASRRRLKVRLENVGETVAIVVVNPGDKDVPLSGVRLRTKDNQVLPLDSLTEGHFPLSLAPGTSYKLPLKKANLYQVLERNAVATRSMQAEVFDAAGKTRRSAYSDV